jgi:hypothetical protein
VAFVGVVAHVAGVLGADVCYGVGRSEDCEKRFSVAISGGGAVAPCNAVAEGEDEERNAVLDADVAIVGGEGRLEGDLGVGGCGGGSINEGEVTRGGMTYLLLLTEGRGKLEAREEAVGGS